MKVISAFLIFFCVLVNAWSYPIFYKCGPNGELSENLNAQEITELAEQNREKIGECDSFDCLKQFKQIFLMATGSMDLATRLYEKTKTLSDAEFESLSKTAKLALEIKMCHEAQKVIPSSDSQIGKFDPLAKVDIYYPNDTLYQFVTGYRKNNRNDYNGFSRPYEYHLNEILVTSIKAGVDPLAVLGVVMMERGGGNIDQWYKNMHDKRSQMVLGCNTGGSLGQIAKRSDEINQISKDLGHHQAKTSYLCVGRKKDGQYIDDTKGFQSYASLEEAKEDKKVCCIKTKYKDPRSWDSNEEGRKLTTLLYFKQLQDLDHYNPMAGKKNQKSPTHRLNTFLGMSSTVGTFPSFRVSPARVGINSFKDPNYGRQVMDWQLNSFLRNSHIMNKIEQLSKKHGKPHYSLLCADKKPGNYVINSDHYLEKMKASERMLPIKNLFDKGKSWNQLGIKYQSVLLQEFTAKGSAVKDKLSKYLSKEEMGKLEKHADHLYRYRNASLRRGKKNPGPLPPEGNAIFDKVYRLYFSKPDLYESRKTFAQASAQDSGFTWGKASDEDILKISKEVGASK